MPYENCLARQDAVIAAFAACQTEEAKYEHIIGLGKKNPPLDEQYKIPENLVAGCQSRMYLHSWLEGSKVRFAAESDALISSGLAALLIQVYDGESPETILKCPPDYLEVIGIQASLTANRSNGLFSIHLRMKQDALKHLLTLQKQSK